LECHSHRGFCSSGSPETGRWTLNVVGTLAALALIFSAHPVYAANSEIPASHRLWDATVRVFPTPTSLDSSSNSSFRTVLAFDTAQQQSTDAVTTTEIPSAAPAAAPTSAQPAATNAQVPAQQPASADYDDGIIRYEHAKNPDISGPPVGTLDDFMSEGDITSPLGFEVREDKRRLKGGAEAQGLLIMGIVAGSPAARAGLHAYHRAVRDVLETAAVAGALFVPPVVLLVPVFDQVRLGETYDLIIGVDGSRVTNFLDFQDRLRDVQPGEIVYFSIIRNGVRMQIAVPVPSDFANPRF
jgi:PDZ domain